MQSFRIILTIIIVSTIGSTSYATGDETKYQFPDTLNVMVDENIRLMIVSENLYHFQPSDTIDKLIAKFNDDILKIEYPDAENVFFKIYYNIGTNGSSSIKFEDITENDRKYQILENGETIIPIPIELIMTVGKDTRAIFYLSGPESFESLGVYNFQDLLSSIIEIEKEEVPNMRRKQVSVRWWIKDGKPDPGSKETSPSHLSNDMIHLAATVSGSLIRNKLVPSIDLHLGVIIGKKRYMQHKIMAEMSMLYIFNKDTEGEYSTDINTFLGLNYYVNSSKNPDKPKWFGLGLSYLTWRNGNFFDKNTFRLSVGASWGDHFSVMPELYISDGFKKVMPGLKFQVWF